MRFRMLYTMSASSRLASRTLGVVCAVVSVVLSATSLLADELPGGEFAARIQANRFTAATARRLSEGGHAVLLDIAKQCETLGRMLTMREAMLVMSRASSPITNDDYFGIVSLVKRSQQPKLKKEDVEASLRDAMAAIRTIDVTYDVEYAGGARDNITSRNRFMLDGALISWDRMQTVVPESARPQREINSYDGNHWFNVMTSGRENIDQWERGTNVLATKRSLDSRTRFLDNTNPLVLQKLLQVSNTFDVPPESSEPIEGFFNRAALFETTEQSNGRECVCVSCVDQTWYLCPELGFALVSKREDEFAFDLNAGRVIETGVFEEQHAEDFTLAGDAVWLPRRITRTVFRRDETEVQQIKLHEIHVNDPIDRSTFSSVVPSGALLADAEHPVARRVSSPADIEAALDRSIRPRSQTGLWILIGNALVIAILILVSWKRKRTISE